MQQGESHIYCMVSATNFYGFNKYIVLTSADKVHHSKINTDVH